MSTSDTATSSTTAQPSPPKSSTAKTPAPKRSRPAAAAGEVLIATQDLFIERARAHRVGDEVPADNVKRHGWADLVAAPGSAAARVAQSPDD